MTGLRLTIEDGKFCDGHGRQVVLRGINVAGEAKYPSRPHQPSHVPDDFFDGDNVSFVGRPFPSHEAHLHFSRLKRYGYNTIRYVFTWEAIEAAGPGIYDEAWIAETIEVLRAAKRYGFYIFMDPHQDVWSRFSGGSGAPMWTLYAAGLNPQSFAATEAAIVHNTYPEPDKFPKMIWSTNYYRLAAATMFTLFFAGRDFAPKCILDGMNIQDYLQGHFLRACAHLARRIHEAGDIENDVVFGWETLNEPNKGMIGYEDISVIPKEQALKKGTCPTIWQAMLLGSGRAVEVETWDMGGLGPYKFGRTLVDPHGEVAWLPAGYDESRYGYKRDPGWKLGECLWAQHGVWDPSTDTLLRKDYFRKHPTTGDTIDYPYFTNTYFMDFYRKFRDAIRAHHADAIMLLQGPTMELPPLIKGTPDGDDPRLVYAPHWYDGITLMTKKWNRNWNVDVIGVLRGRYWHPAFAIKLGETAIRNCFRDQHAAMRKEGLDRMGNHPCVMTEFGIPYDMDDKYAYRTGDYSSQSAAMDANHFAVEAAGLEGYTLWLYMATNDHERGDQWNGEDLSIFSIDDKLLPLSALPRNPGIDGSSTTALRSSVPRKELDDDDSVTPANLKRSLTNPSISSEATSRQPELTACPGYRAAEAYVRPAPTTVAGVIASYGFDLRQCVFTLALTAPRAADPLAPTVVFLPEYHFPRDACVVEASSGKWEISCDEDEAVLVQRLRWWHGPGEQTLRVSGVVRKLLAAEAVGGGAAAAGAAVAEDAGYYEQCNQGAWSNCALM
ncbi:19bb662d-47d8-4dbe-8d87-e351ab77b0c3 [Thermothielavioides terrestris]|uniref:19bb662d-47d8-4dbe-8d87-e351ab77b0c3 n=1 Tax=Thermothielavioides terrestris TaxID=2587410 RepID=A0A3S4B8Q1_9PEZI|nr:19bb662d-47d8-4dbe-8d87-e351ab77b0c3 [Thermothielavioides terrestris]